MSNTTSNTSQLTLNETIVRLTGAFASVITIAAIISQWYIFPLYLSIDFFFRAFTGIKPPLALLSQSVAKELQLKEKQIYAPPKKFAAAVGFVFSVSITILLLFQFINTALVVAAVLLFCAVLESIFAICIGCYVYDWVVVPLQNKFKQL